MNATSSSQQQQEEPIHVESIIPSITIESALLLNPLGSGTFHPNNNNNINTTTIINTNNNNLLGTMIGAPSGINEISLADESDNLSSFMATSSNARASVFQIFNEKLANFYLTVKTSETEIRTYERVLIFCFYMYMYWVNLVFPTLSSERSNYVSSGGSATTAESSPYGVYASWVFRVLNYPITLSLDATSFTANIAITSVLVAMYFIFLTILVVEFRTLKGKVHSRIRVWRQRFGVFVAIISPLTLFMMANFIDCNTNKKVYLEKEHSYVNMLSRHETIACFGNENLSLFIASCLLMFVVVFATACSILFMPNNANSRLPFISYDNVPVMLNISSIGLEIFIKFLIPPAAIYMKGAIHIVSSLAQLILIIRMVPLFNRSFNGVYISTLSGRLGTSIGVFINQLIFKTMPNFGEGTALGLMSLTLFLMVTGAIIGGVGMEIYTRRLMQQVRNQFRSKISQSSWMDERKNALLERELVSFCTSQKNTRNLNLFLRFSPENPDDLQMAISFIKVVSSHKCMTSPNVLLTSALVVAYYWNDENSASFANYILKKAKRFCNNTWTRILIMERTKEIEVYSSTKTHGINQVEIKCMLHDMEKQQEELWAIHRMFWKEIISDLPNEMKINQLISRASALGLYCDERFKHLMTNFKHDKTVLRFYANYLENFKFDKESAADFYEQAYQLEEEESKTQPIVRRFEKKVKSKMEKHSTVYSTLGPTSLAENRRNTMIELEEEKFEGIEVSGSTEKKHLFIRNALNTPYQSKVRNYALIGLACFQLVLLLVAFVLCTVYGSLVTEIPLSLDSCLPGTSPSTLVREVRMGQIYNELYKNQQLSPPPVNTSQYDTLQYFLKNHQRKLQRILTYLENLATNSISSKFTQEMLEDYKSPINPIVVPTASVGGVERVYTTSYKKNISMSELTREFISNTKLIYNWNSDNYNQTIQSYEFMYIFLNRRAATDANALFCSNFQIRKRSQNSKIDRTLRIYLFISTFILILIYGSFLLLSRIAMTKSSLIIKLFSKIPKDLIGSIYHELQKRSTQEVKHLRSVVSHKFMALSFGFLSLIVFSGCISLMYVENNLNVALSSQAMVNVDTATSVIRAAVRLNVRLGELFAYYGIAKGHSVNDPALANQANLDTYHSDNRFYISEAQTQFAELLFGGNLTSSIFNKYSGVDEVITSPLTCMNGTCYDLQELFAQVLHLCSKFNEDILNPFYAKAPDTYLYFLSIFNMTDEMIERLLELLTALSSTSSSKVISIVFFTFGFLILLAFNYLIYMSFHTTDYDITTLRTFLNYIPIDYLDSNDNLKNFIVNNTLSNSGVRRKTEYDDAIKNLLNSMIEGAVTCNERGEVTFINIAAQKMFGKSAVDVLGLPCTVLFDPNSHEMIKKATSEFKYHRKGGEENEFGEVIEIECIRKNSSKFSAKVSVFGTEISSSSFVVSLFIKDITMEKKQTSLLAEEKKNSENLLRNILPDAVATKLKNGETFIAERFADITCYFSDMVGFTTLSSRMNPSELVLMLNRIVNGFDDLTDKYNLEKIKTIGDSYFCVGGLHGVNAQSDHPERTLKFAIDTLSVIRSYNSDNLDSQLNIRIGLNTGGVIAGVIGRKKFAYDLWGDTINTASRMESTGVQGRIQLARSTYERTYDLYEFEERIVEVKGKGECKTYLIKEKHHVNPIVTRPSISMLIDHNISMISPAGEDI